MNKSTALIAFKIVLTIPVAHALIYPLLHPQEAGGIFKELEALGLMGSTIFVSVFLALVFMYCRDLSRSLSLVHPSARAASPQSVWLMFLIPYNFVEDFFIVANVARSLRKEAQSNPALRSFKGFGMVSGLGWCAAQIVSLLPNEIGSMAGVLALPLWIVHWRLIRRANKAIAEAAIQHHHL